MMYRQADRGHNRDEGPHPDGAVLRWVVPVVGPVYRPDYEAMAKRVTDATYALDDWTEAQVVDLMRVAVGLVEVGEDNDARR